MNLKMQLYTPDSNHPGLIDLGNLIKAIIMDESRFSQWEDPMADEKDKKPKGHDFVGGGYTRWGLMAVGIHETSTIKATANQILIRVFPGATGFTIGGKMYDPFLNIGAGVGHFMCALTPNWRTSPLNHTPTWKELKDAVLNYNGGSDYKNRVWERFQKYRESSNKIINP